MNLAAAIRLTAYGTSESVKKAWDTRGRGKADFVPQSMHDTATKYGYEHQGSGEYQHKSGRKLYIYPEKSEEGKGDNDYQVRDTNGYMTRQNWDEVGDMGKHLARMDKTTPESSFTLRWNPRGPSPKGPQDDYGPGGSHTHGYYGPSPQNVSGLK